MFRLGFRDFREHDFIGHSIGFERVILRFFERDSPLVWRASPQLQLLGGVGGGRGGCSHSNFHLISNTSKVEMQDKTTIFWSCIISLRNNRHLHH